MYNFGTPQLHAHWEALWNKLTSSCYLPFLSFLLVVAYWSPNSRTLTVSVNTPKAESQIFWLAYSTRSAKTFQWKQPITTYFV